MSYDAKKIYKKDWVLSAEAFEKLLFNLDENAEKASLVYEDIRKRLIRQFRANQSQIAEEQADEVFNRIARKIYEEDFVLDKNNPYPYFHQTARYILLEQQRHSRRRILGLDDLPMAEEPSYNPEEILARFSERLRDEAGLRSLRECRESLSERDINLLDRYDAAKGKEKKTQRQQLAEETGKTVNALKISINRIRKKLIDCAKKKLKSIEALD
jgi:DNA-directed RNA polymerase specialized sigma24 family protein